MKEKKTIKRSVTVAVTLIFAISAVLAAVYLTARGYTEAAIETVIRWGEDGTTDAVGRWVVEELLPMLGQIGAGAGALLAVLLPLLKKLKDAKKMLDAGTAEAVATYGERKKMQEEMRSFIAEQTAVMKSLREEQKASMEAMHAEQRESLAADRAAIKRLEGKVDGLRQMELAAHSSTSELVKKGTAVRIEEICKETEGKDHSLEKEGGEGREAVGDDCEAAEDQETH